MKLRLIFPALMFGLLAVSPLAHGQTPEPTLSPLPTEGASVAPPQSMQGMDKMSDSVTKMSEMCQMMMKKEMASAPFKMAAGIGIGALLLIALILFVILEVQWIIYWSRSLKTQKRGDRI